MWTITIFFTTSNPPPQKKKKNGGGIRPVFLSISVVEQLVH